MTTPEKDKWIEEKVDQFLRADWDTPEGNPDAFLRATLNLAWQKGRKEERRLNIDGAFNLAEATMEVWYEKKFASYKADLAGKIEALFFASALLHQDKLGDGRDTWEISKRDWNRILTLLQPPPEETKT